MKAHKEDGRTAVDLGFDSRVQYQCRTLADMKRND